MSIRQQLAAALTEILNAQGRSLSATATELGISRQRLHQLRTGDKSGAPEAIEEVIERLGYEVQVSIQKKGE